jgi:predicted ester cyclase
MKKILLLMSVTVLLLASCSNDKKKEDGDKKEAAATTGESKQERNKKIIMASMDAFAKRDVDAMVKDAAPGYTDFGDGTMAPLTNVDSSKAFIRMLLASIENYNPSNAILVAEGDYVYYFADWSGVFKNDLMGIKATGKPFGYKDCDYFKLNEEGKITEHHSIQNMEALFTSPMITK